MRKTKKFSNVVTTGSALPASDVPATAASFPFMKITDRGDQTPPQAVRNMQIRGQYKDMKEKFGPMSSFDPNELAQVEDFLERDFKEFSLNRLALSAIEIKTIYDKSRINKLRPEILQAHRSALDVFIGISEMIHRLMVKTYIDEQNELDFLYDLLDPNVVVPVFPVWDVFGLYCFIPTTTTTTDAVTGVVTTTVKRPLDPTKDELKELFDFVDPQMAYILNTGLVGKGKFIQSWSNRAKLRIAQNVLPQDNATKIDADWLKTYQLKDPITGDEDKREMRYKTYVPAIPKFF